MLTTLVFAMGGCSSNPPAQSAATASKTPAQPTGNENGASSSTAADKGTSNKLPPEVSPMMDDQPCQARLHAPLDQHVLVGSGGKGPRPFVIGVGEKLCLVGDSPTTLKLTEAPFRCPRKRNDWSAPSFSSSTTSDRSSSFAITSIGRSATRPSSRFPTGSRRRPPFARCAPISWFSSIGGTPSK